MSADADDLLERAASAEERYMPTLDELKDDLERALDELERRFPRGRPSADAVWDRLAYTSARSTVSRIRYQLQFGDYRDDTAWEAFLAAHPELSIPEDGADDAR